MWNKICLLATLHVESKWINHIKLLCASEEQICQNIKTCYARFLFHKLIIRATEINKTL
jgi:hypothetical protein